MINPLPKILFNVNVTKDNEGPFSNTRQWNEIGKKFIKGKISHIEGKIITETLCNYAYNQQVKPEEIITLLFNQRHTKNSNKNIWPIIAQCLPNRSVQSIHNYCHRKFHPKNYQGRWSISETEELINLYNKHGKKWELIAQSLGRTGPNIKDKFKHIGKDNHNNLLLLSSINFKLIIHLLQLIESSLKTKDSEENYWDYRIFLYSPVFIKDLDKNTKEILTIDEKDQKSYIDNDLEEEQSKIVIRNILKKIIDFRGLGNIIIEKREIEWSMIANEIKVMSVDECRNRWFKFLREVNMELSCELRRDYKMILKIENMNIDSLDDIRWKNIRNSRKEDCNKQCFNDLVLMAIDEKDYDMNKLNTNIKEIIQLVKTMIVKKIQEKQKEEEYINETQDDKFNIIALKGRRMNKYKARNLEKIYKSFLKLKHIEVNSSSSLG